MTHTASLHHDKAPDYKTLSHQSQYSEEHRDMALTFVSFWFTLSRFGVTQPSDSATIG